jgi:GNAT superfamily N-acetyltransferase
MNIRAAVEADAAHLSALALRAKAQWGYAPEVLEAWRSELAITPDTIRSKPTFVAVLEEKIAGFYSLLPSQTSWELAHLWVSPESMHRGIGRALLTHAVETARRGGAFEVTVDADPNAEPFYVQSGAIRRGVVAAPIPGQPQRVRPLFAFTTSATQQGAPADPRKKRAGG